MHHIRQYFADSVSDCVDFFGEETIQPINRDDSVVCDTQFSKVVPLEDGEVLGTVYPSGQVVYICNRLMIIGYSLLDCRLFVEQPALFDKLFQFNGPTRVDKGDKHSYASPPPKDLAGTMDQLLPE